jgi:hypothetical protein
VRSTVYLRLCTCQSDYPITPLRNAAARRRVPSGNLEPPPPPQHLPRQTNHTSRTTMSGTNPDSRPLPNGWITQYDDRCVDGPSKADRAPLTCHPDFSTPVTKLGRILTPLLIFKHQIPIDVIYPGSTSIQRPIRPPQAGLTHWGPLRQIRVTPSLILLTSSPHMVQ